VVAATVRSGPEGLPDLKNPPKPLGANDEHEDENPRQKARFPTIAARRSNPQIFLDSLEDLSWTD